MANNKYPLGYNFNNLTIIEYLGQIDNTNHCFYKCKCKCGKIIKIRTQQINVQKSCGCIKPKTNPHKYIGKHKYPLGYKFNKLTIIEYCGNLDKKYHHCFYKCKCECGRIVNIRTQNINHQKSCGCVPKRKNNKAIKKAIT